MKIALFYFSGTGNTFKVVSRWKEVSSDFDVSINLYNIESTSLSDIDLNSYDKIGFAYPIHAFNAPKNVWKFATFLPKLENKIDAFVIMVSGEYMNINHSSDMKLKRILKRRNIIVTSEYHYLMPYNMIFRHTEDRAFKMYETMYKLVPIDVKEYLKLNVPHKLKKVHPAGWFIFILRIEQWFAHVNGKHYKIDNTKCIKCLKCVNTCPVKNIEYKDGKFYFKNSCLLCTRCSFNCPTDAFKIGLLNNWRVNKPYKFKLSDANEIDKHPKYCKRSYIRYFKEAENRINSNN